MEIQCKIHHWKGLEEITDGDYLQDQTPLAETIPSETRNP